MANSKPNENGSQFYVTLRDAVESLDGKHTIFGTLAEGDDVLDKINTTMVNEKNAPYQNIRIWHTEILDDPFDDPDGLAGLIPPKSPEPIQDEVFKKIEDEEDEAELQERLASTTAKSQATTLEILHDIPDAEIEVPDNDLFIYKLNPITQDGDLELIFSRFGSIKSCEIVRDWKTGDSLQYAFITFENIRDCENAYFKMHDCVIDDRRIGVNFSQSVAKLWNKHRTGARVSSSEAKEAFKGAGKGKGRGGGKGKGKGKGRGQGDVAPLLPAKEERPRDARHGLVVDAVGRDGGGRGPSRSRSRGRRRGGDDTRRSRRRSPSPASPPRRSRH